MSSVAEPTTTVLLKSQQKLTPDEQFAITDWTSKDSIVLNLPPYAQEQHALRKANVKNVTKAVNIENFSMKTPFGDQHLLKNTKLVLEANKRQVLFGANATGKTLLFNNMSSGAIKEFPKHLHVHHCKELETHELHDSVLGTVVNCYPMRNILLKCEKKLKELLASDPAPTGPVKESLSANLLWVQQQANGIRAYDAEERAGKMLRVLGFDDEGQKKLCSALSGGLRMRVALCMAFFIEAEFLLLDEPTNHLDFPSVLWLENRLRGYKGSFLLVSHDRELLNNVCTSVLLLEDKQIKYYMMGFKEFEVKKAAEDKKKFDDIEKFLKKNPNVDPSTQLGREKHDKKEWSETYHRKQVALQGKFTFPAPVALENKELDAAGQPLAPENISLIRIENLRFSYNPAQENPVFIFNDPIEFNVTATTRVGVMGPNGAGKSTLLKLLTKKLVPTEGTVYTHPNFTLAYFGQHSTAELDLNMTAFEFMCHQFPKESTGLLRQHLGKTGIVGTVADTRMQRLSFSQRSCIIFAKLTYVCPHLLIMDEPTNFLDLESVDSLIGACNKYKGALLLVSHNRDFLRKCATGYLSVVPGNFKLYQKMKEAENATYSFIAEMEEGGKASAKDMLTKNPGGGSVHSSQKTGGGDSEKKDAAAEVVGGVKVLTIGSGPVQGLAALAKSAAPGGAAAAAPYAVGETVQALWKDGKYYAALVNKIKGDEYTITYTEYGNAATVSGASLKKAVAKPGAKGTAAPAGKATAKAGGRK